MSTTKFRHWLILPLIFGLFLLSIRVTYSKCLDILVAGYIRLIKGSLCLVIGRMGIRLSCLLAITERAKPTASESWTGKFLPRDSSKIVPGLKNLAIGRMASLRLSHYSTGQKTGEFERLLLSTMICIGVATVSVSFPPANAVIGGMAF